MKKEKIYTENKKLNTKLAEIQCQLNVLLVLNWANYNAACKWRQ